MVREVGRYLIKKKDILKIEAKVILSNLLFKKWEKNDKIMR